MASSETVIIALRYDTGVVFASDSQTSDLINRVRWETTKARQIGTQPLVMAFSGNSGISGRARASVEEKNFRPTTFKKRELVRKMIESGLESHYKWIADRMKPESAFKDVIGVPQMVALVACFAEGEPQIIEFERDGDSDFHDYFHAVGSGGSTAYAVWRTLGGKRLRTLQEGRAIHVALRILRTAVDLDVQGVDDPFTVFIVDERGARPLPSAVVDAEMQTAQEWEEQQVQQLLSEGEAGFQ